MVWERIDPENPLFVQALCLVSKEGHRTQIGPEIADFKHRWFGHGAVVLHAHEIRKEKGDFTFLFNRTVRERFLADLTGLMDRLPYTLIASAINKEHPNHRYTEPDSLNSIAMRFCLERSYLFLREQGEGERLTHVLAESRGRKEDADLELAFRRICDGDNATGQWLPFEAVFVDKKQNLAGLQLADLVSHPIGRHLLKPGRCNRAYEVVEKKFRRSGAGKLEGYGLKIFP